MIMKTMEEPPPLGLYAVTTEQCPKTLMIIAAHAVTSRRNKGSRAVTFLGRRLAFQQIQKCANNHGSKWNLPNIKHALWHFIRTRHEIRTIQPSGPEDGPASRAPPVRRRGYDRGVPSWAAR